MTKGKRSFFASQTIFFCEINPASRPDAAVMILFFANLDNVFRVGWGGAALGVSRANLLFLRVRVAEEN
jgi:hypothetical protein